MTKKKEVEEIKLTGADAVAKAAEAYPELAALVVKTGEQQRKAIGNIVCDDGKIRLYTLVVNPDSSQFAELVGEDDGEEELPPTEE